MLCLFKTTDNCLKLNATAYIKNEWEMKILVCESHGLGNETLGQSNEFCSALRKKKRFLVFLKYWKLNFREKSKIQDSRVYHYMYNKMGSTVTLYNLTKVLCNNHNNINYYIESAWICSLSDKMAMTTES